MKRSNVYVEVADLTAGSRLYSTLFGADLAVALSDRIEPKGMASSSRCRR